jgi:hypothetical protein
MYQDEHIHEAERRRRAAWKQLQVSTDRFQQAELSFEWRTDKVRALHGLQPDDRLTVEALLERSRDEVWQNAVKDCVYFAARMSAYGALHQAAVAELRILRG